MRTIIALLSFGLVTSAYAQNFTGGTATGTGYPGNSIPFTATATGTTSATLTVTPPAGRTVWICGVAATEMAGTGQTAVGTITNLLGPTGAAVSISFLYSGTLGATSAAWIVNDAIPCSPAVAGLAVVVTTPTATAATNTALNVSGFYMSTIP
jgi:hypothetical protein